MVRVDAEDGTVSNSGWAEDGTVSNGGWAEDGTVSDGGWAKNGTVSEGGWAEDGTVFDDDATDARATSSMVRARGVVVYWSSSTGGDDTVSGSGWAEDGTKDGTVSDGGWAEGVLGLGVVIALTFLPLRCVLLPTPRFFLVGIVLL
jgi:hypothetical protein